MPCSHAVPVPLVYDTRWHVTEQGRLMSSMLVSEALLRAMVQPMQAAAALQSAFEGLCMWNSLQP